MISILDGNNLAFRIWQAMSEELVSPSGERVGIIYGFLKMLQAHYKQSFVEGGQIVVAWDSKGSKAKRLAIYPEYKGKRKKDDLDFANFIGQTTELKKILDLLPICQLELNGYEGDDLIAAACKLLKETPKVIVSADKDLAQLINEHTSLFKLGMYAQDHKLVTPENFSEALAIKYARGKERVAEPMPYNRIVDYKILKGDSSDNIKGIPGIGDVATVDLLRSFSSIDAIVSYPGEPQDKALAKAVRAVKSNAAIIPILKQLINLNTFLDSEILTYVGTELIKDRYLKADELKATFMAKGFESFLKNFIDFIFMFQAK